MGIKQTKKTTKQKARKIIYLLVIAAKRSEFKKYALIKILLYFYTNV